MRIALQQNVLYIALSLVCYLAVNAVYFPRIASISDEYDFLAQAEVFGHGSLSMEGAGLTSLPGMVEVNGKHYSWRNPGLPLVQSFLLRLGGQELCHAYSFLVHLLLFFLSVLVLRKLNASPLWALLILAHPTLVIYSRTMLADETGALAILAAFYFLALGPRPFLIGLCLGIACLFRMQCAVTVPFFWLAMLMQQNSMKPSRAALRLTAWFTAGTLPGLVLLFGYYGYIFGSYTGKSDQYAFSASFLAQNLQHFGTALAIWWPLMIAVPFIAKSRFETSLRMIYLPFLVMLLFYFWYDQRPNPLITSVIGQRLLIPVIPLFVIAYALTVERLVEGFKPKFPALNMYLKWLKPGVLVLSCSLVLLLSRQHGNYLNDLQKARIEVESYLAEDAVVICNPSFRELFFQRMPYKGLFEFRHWYYGDTGGLAPLKTDGSPLYLGLYSKGKDTSQDEEILKMYREVTQLEEITTSEQYLRLFRVSPL